MRSPSPRIARLLRHSRLVGGEISTRLQSGFQIQRHGRCTREFLHDKCNVVQLGIGKFALHVIADGKMTRRDSVALD